MSQERTGQKLGQLDRGLQAVLPNVSQVQTGIRQGPHRQYEVLQEIVKSRKLETIAERGVRSHGYAEGVEGSTNTIPTS